MHLKPFIALAAVTVVVVAGTLFAINQHQASTRGATERELLFPGMTDRINDVDRVTVQTSADGTVTMQRENGTWGMVERFGYPVDFDKVRGVLIELATLTAIEPRTSNPELYQKLQVEDVEQDLSSSIRITAAAGDEVLADLIVGKTRPVDQGGGVFVRKMDEEQSWLAEGSLQPERRFVQWLERNIVNVDQRRVRRAEIGPPGENGVVIVKDDPAAKAYSLETPIPEGREVKPDSELRALASITDFLILEDVRPESEVDFTDPEFSDRFVTFDGLELTMDVVEQDEETWVRVEATKADRTEGLNSFVEEQQGKDSREGRIADEMLSAEEVEKEITAINDLASDWTYRVTDYKTGKLKTTISEVTEEIKAEESDTGSDTGTSENAMPPTSASDAGG